ncbi:hypothetical protein CHUAL_000033 [Chamberlinius hualienensis]
MGQESSRKRQTFGANDWLCALDCEENMIVKDYVHIIEARLIAIYNLARSPKYGNCTPSTINVLAKLADINKTNNVNPLEIDTKIEEWLGNLDD